MSENGLTDEEQAVVAAARSMWPEAAAGTAYARTRAASIVPRLLAIVDRITEAEA